MSYVLVGSGLSSLLSPDGDGHTALHPPARQDKHFSESARCAYKYVSSPAWAHCVRHILGRLHGEGADLGAAASGSTFDSIGRRAGILSGVQARLLRLVFKYTGTRKWSDVCLNL